MSDTTICIRSLRLHEVDEWLTHLANCFAYKQVPRAYFERHWNAECRLKVLSTSTDENIDSTVDVERVFIATTLPFSETGTERILSSCRVVIRQVYINGNTHFVGGIADVCTDVDARGKGLASIILHYALKYLYQIGIRISFLHTSNVVPYYARLGWQTIERYMNVYKACKSIENNQRFSLSVINTDNTTLNNNTSIQLVSQDLPFSQSLVNELKDIYSKFASQFDGTIVREYRYWKHWIEEETICLKNQHSASISFVSIYSTKKSDDVETPKLIGYAILQYQTAPIDVYTNAKVKDSAGNKLSLPYHIFIREIVCISEQDQNTTALRFFTLNQVIEQTVAQLIPTELEGIQDIFVRLPAPFLSNELQFEHPPYLWIDKGMMYRSISLEDAQEDILKLCDIKSETADIEQRTNPSSRQDKIIISPINNSTIVDSANSIPTAFPDASKHVFFATDSF